VIQALQDLHVVDIAAGEDHSAAILSSGELYMWGSSDMGKLGYAGSGLIPKRVGGALTKESVTSVSLGMSHSAAVTKSHRLYMWGGGWYVVFEREARDFNHIPQILQISLLTIFTRELRMSFVLLSKIVTKLYFRMLRKT
jgi:alpha-tubulin suppressor-like RCC1 family protein